MIERMSEPTTPSEPATGPVATATPPPPSQPTYVERERDREPRRSRLITVAAWVGIVAGVVFIVAVVFFSGFILGAHSGGDRGHHHGGGERDFAMMHRGGPPPMFQIGPRGEFGPGGPGFQLPSPQQPSAPTTTAPSHP
jgi:hypothetical protein